MSTTPRTDEAQITQEYWTRVPHGQRRLCRDYVVPADFARQLETELIEAREQSARFRDAIQYACYDGIHSDARNRLLNVLAMESTP